MRPLLPLVLLAGCSVASTGWQPLPRVDRPVADVTAAARDVLKNEGFVLETEAPSEGGTLLSTAWREQLSTRSRVGTRRRIEILVLPAEGGGSVAKVRGFLQYNENTRKPDVSEEAIWLPTSEEDDQPLRIREMLRLRLQRPTLE